MRTQKFWTPPCPSAGDRSGGGDAPSTVTASPPSLAISPTAVWFQVRKDRVSARDSTREMKHAVTSADRDVGLAAARAERAVSAALPRCGPVCARRGARWPAGPPLGRSTGSSTGSSTGRGASCVTPQTWIWAGSCAPVSARGRVRAGGTGVVEATDLGCVVRCRVGLPMLTRRRSRARDHNGSETVAHALRQPVTDVL